MPTDECFLIKAFASILYWYLWKRVDEISVFSDVGQRVVHVAAWALCSLTSQTLNSPKGSNKLKVPSFFKFSTILQNLSPSRGSGSFLQFALISHQFSFTSWLGWRHIWHNCLSGFNSVEITLIYFKGTFLYHVMNSLSESLRWTDAALPWTWNVKKNHTIITR